MRKGPAHSCLPYANDPFSLCNLCSASGRGVPDISIQAIAYQFFFDRRAESMNGTSCSTPVRFLLLGVFFNLHSPTSSTFLTANPQAAAAIISLLNDYLISNDRPPLGWLNPWLYGGGLAGLNDITSGSNPGCNTDGFSAIPGWDPVRPIGISSFYLSVMAHSGVS